jgi:thiosulfate/3-mercaptopyruvate sulfurtransferase
VSRYVIVGAGGIGVTFAAELQRAGRDVVLVSRGAQLAALRDGEVRYARPDGTRRLELPAIGDPSEIELTVGDVLVLATKTQDVEPVIAQWAPRPVRPADGTVSTAGASIPVLTLQNGLEAERIALRRFKTVFGGVLWLPASYVRVGEISAPGWPAVGVVWIGAYPDGAHPAHPALAAIAADLRASAFEAQVVEDIQRWKAAKLTSSVTFALAALYPPSELRDRAAQLLRAEAREILTASGQDIADTERETTADTSRVSVRKAANVEYGGNSTWQSITRSSPLETDYLNGEIVLAARLLGRTAPVNEAVAERADRAWRDGAAAGTLGEEDLLATVPQLRSGDVLIDAVTLRKLLDGPGAPAVLDVRWALGDPNGREHFLAGHIPGAVYADLDTEFAAPPTTGAGRHPLPDPAALQEAARGWGLRTGQPVVVYDANGGLAAARAWWVLRWAGLPDVRILDGALAAWTEAGFELRSGEEQPDRGDVSLDGGHLPVLTVDEAAALARDGVLLDARAGERYRGETEPVDAQAGHIPGARSAPAADNLTADGSFAAPEALRARYAELGAVPGVEVGVYCGSGVTAAHDVAALRIAGIDAALYPGSWSAWSADPRRPVATGTEPR